MKNKRTSQFPLVFHKKSLYSLLSEIYHIQFLKVSFHTHYWQKKKIFSINKSAIRKDKE